ELNTKQTERLRRELQNWEEAARPNLQHISPMARFQVKNYIKSVDQFVVALENPRQRVSVASTLLGSEMHFEGGAVADLVRHLLDNRLAAKAGSQAQVLMSEVG